MKLKDFKLASLEEIAKAKEFPKGVRGGNVGGGILIGSPGGINSTIIYKVMQDTFGPINTDYVGEKSAWEWVLKTDKGLLSVYDYKGGWSIGYVGSKPGLREELREYADILKDVILEEANKVKISKKKIKESTIGGIITNPYALFSSTSDQLLEEAKKVISEIKEYKINKDNLLNTKGWNRSLAVAALFRVAFITSYLGIEGFINIVYTIFLNKRYKNEVFERKLQNEMIITKLLEIDKYCGEFKDPVISIDEELFKAFQHLTNIRNDFVHANIIKDMKSHLVQVGPYQLLAEEKSERKYGISAHPGRITNVDVIRTQRLIQKIVIKIINALNERIRWKFAVVHSYWRLPYYYNDKGLVDFPLTEDDYVPDEEIERVLSLTPDLDDEYYDVGEEEYVPPASRIY